METLPSTATPGSRAAAPGRERMRDGKVLFLLAANGSLIAGVYAAAGVAARHAVDAVGLLAWQLAFAALALGGIAVSSGHWPRIDGARLRYALLAGLLGVSLPNVASFTALSHLPAAEVGVVAALSPVFTYAFAVGLRSERISVVRVAGLGLGLVGVGWVLWPADGAAPGMASALALVAPVMLAAGNVYRSLAWPPGLTPLGAAALMLAGQAILVVPVAVANGAWVWPSAVGAEGGAALWAVGGMTAAFYLGAFELQRRGGAVVTGQLGYVITLASLAIGVLVFDDSPPASTWCGAALAIVGVLLVLRGGPRAQVRP